MARFLKILAIVALVGLTTGVVITALALRWRAPPESSRAASVHAPPASPTAVDAVPLAPRFAAPASAAKAAGQEVASAGSTADAMAAEREPGEPVGGGSGDGRTPVADAGVEDAALESGWLTVESRRRVLVRVGREVVGSTPVRRLSLPPGRHAVVARSRHGVRRRTVVVERGAEVRVFFNL